MYSSNKDAIAALVQQKVIVESEGFDYTGHEFESLFRYIFHFASDNLLASVNIGEAMPITFFIHSNPNFLAMASSDKAYITVSKGIVERLNYAIPENCVLPTQLNGIEELAGKELRIFLLEICAAFVFYHEKAHIMHKIRPVDILNPAPLKEVAQIVEEFDEDLAAVDSIFSDVLRHCDIVKNAEILATTLLTAFNVFFMAMEHTFAEAGHTLTPPVHLRYASCMLQVFKCLADKGIEFTDGDFERIINNAEQSCKQITSQHLRDNINRFYAALKDTTNLQKDLQQFAGQSSRFPLLDLSILLQIK